MDIPSSKNSEFKRQSHHVQFPAPGPAHEPAHPAPAKGRQTANLKLGSRWLKRLAILATVLIFAGLAYGYWHTKSELNNLSNPKTAGQNETQQVVGKVGKLVSLPGGETPTLATVNDASKLKSQVFFADAQNGDKVLIYNHAGKAVLYRPSTNKVVAYSKINLNGSQ
jgi:hypothetical protein